MGQSLAVLGILAAVLAAGMTWEIPSRPEPAPPVVRTKSKPTVKKKIRVQPLQDNSNSSYAALGIPAVDSSSSQYVALGLRATPPGFGSACRRAVWRLQATGRGMLALKHQAWKSILGRTS